MSYFYKTLKIIGLLAVTAWLFGILALKFESHEYAKLSPKEVAAANHYLAGKLPEIPDHWQWHTFTPEQGVDLRTGVIDADNAKGTIILVPGYTGFADLSMRTILKLNAAGYRVATIEYRGQGGSYRPLSNPEKGYVESYEKLAHDVALFAQKWRIEGKPLFFFATSKGGHITMRMAAEESIEVDAYALVVPMIKFKAGDFDYSIMDSMVTVLDAIGLGEMYAPSQGNWPPDNLKFGEATPCNANPETAQLQSALYASNPKLRTNGITVHWARETMKSTKKLLSQDSLDKITQPIKIFTAGADTFVDTNTAQKFCDSLSNCKYTHFEDARHCINREDFDRMDEIIRQTLEHYAANS